MTIPCQVVSVLSPANITATAITITTNECNEPCTTDVTITWENTGTGTGSFEPAILVNSIRTGSGLTITLKGSETYQYIFTLTELLEGSYTVCPDPN